MKEFSRNYTVDDAHIDVQQIMDGLYYPYYMEICRHEFIKEILGFDLEEEASKGINMVLSQFTIKFLRSLRKDDQFTVTCELYADSTGQPRIHFKQKIIKHKKLMTIGIFSGTCVAAAGGRPFLPHKLKTMLQSLPVIEVNSHID
jgi:acyl-CoA thioester hydrolase